MSPSRGPSSQRGCANTSESTYCMFLTTMRFTPSSTSSSIAASPSRKRARTSPTPNPANPSVAPQPATPGARMPFNGDVAGITWHGQALLAAVCCRQHQTIRRTMTLAQPHDFALFQETHGNVGKADSFRLPSNPIAFWNHGSNPNRQARLAFFIQKIVPISVPPCEGRGLNRGGA